MPHPTHRDHINAVRAKRLREDLDDDDASRIEALLAADQRRDHDRLPYQESAQLDDRRQANAS